MGVDHPLEIVYFVEGPSGQRMLAVQAANLLNSLDVQRAAIVLGYRVQGILAQREYFLQNIRGQQSNVVINKMCFFTKKRRDLPIYCE